MSGAVLYAEVPGFYAEIERASDPERSERPLIVGGHPRKGGRVQSASQAAALAGGEPGMAMQDALQRCPRARTVRTDMKRYREVAQRLRACLRQEAARLETAGLEACYLEARGEPESLAETLRRRVRDELGLPLRVGIAPVKFLAKLAAEECGWDGQRRIAAGEEGAFLDALPVADEVPRVEGQQM